MSLGNDSSLEASLPIPTQLLDQRNVRRFVQAGAAVFQTSIFTERIVVDELSTRSVVELLGQRSRLYRVKTRARSL